MLLPYLEGAHFTLCTDHDSLKWLFGPSSTSRKLTRLRLQELSVAVEYLFNKKKIATDAISRLHNKYGDDTGTPSNPEVPVLGIEDKVNPRTIEEYEVSVL